jgi:hypothetical protein
MFMISPDITLTATVRLHNAAESVDYADVQTDHNQTLNAIYTVPASTTAYLTGVYADYIPTAVQDPDNVHFHLQARRNADSEPWRVVQSFGTTPGQSSFERQFKPYLRLPERTDIRVTVRPEGRAVHAHAAFDLILVDD